MQLHTEIRPARLLGRSDTDCLPRSTHFMGQQRACPASRTKRLNKVNWVDCCSDLQDESNLTRRDRHESWVEKLAKGLNFCRSVTYPIRPVA